MTDTEQTTTAILTTHALPAILIGGPPNAGKSVLTYNLTQELRRRDIPHYVFRANPDIEGDWFLQDQDNVRSINVSFQQYRAQWTPEFREFVCRDLALRRHLPLIVDLGGRPKTKEDQDIFRVCTHSILLLKDDEKDLSQTWRDFVRANDVFPLAEIVSELEGTSTLTSWKPIIKGTLTGLVRGIQHIPGPVFKAVVDCVADLFSSYSKAELDKLHREKAPIESVIHLDDQLRALASDTNKWTHDLLEPLLARLSPQTPMAVYGRGPNWLYGALALHAGTAPFYQFDVRLGWVSIPTLQASTTKQLPGALLHIELPYTDEEQYVIEMHPRHNYIDYTDVNQLVFPEPPPNRGVIVSGKLPLWLFTALARFYAQLNVPWIALTDAHNNTAIVIHSRVEKYLISDPIRMPV